MTKYPATVAYLKQMLANVAALTTAVDTDLANPQFKAELAAFKDGERDDLPNGQTLCMLNALAEEPATQERSQLGERACLEFRKPKGERRGLSDNFLSVAFDSLNTAYGELRRQCDAVLRKGGLCSLPHFKEFWDFVRYERYMEARAGTLRTNRRPRIANESEAASFLLYLLQTYSDLWPWEVHNKWVEQLRRSKNVLDIFSNSTEPEGRTLYRVEVAMREELQAIIYRDDLEEFDIKGLLREVCPQLMEHLPAAIPPDTTVDGRERANAYLKLEGLVLAELKQKREAADLANSAIVPKADPSASGEGDGTATKSQTEPTAENVATLGNVVQLAYWSFKAIETQSGRKLEDHEAYDILIENGLSTDKGKLGELADYNPPAFETWARYLRDARKATGESKYAKRAGRSHGKSIATPDEI